MQLSRNHITFLDQSKRPLKNLGSSYLINFDLLPVGVDCEGLAFAALARLNLADDDCAHVCVLVDDGHHEGAVNVALQGRQRVQVGDEGFLSE